MRKNKFTLLAIIAFSITHSAFGQVSGYMGYRFMGGLGTGIIPSFIYPKANEKRGFAFQPGAYVEYATKNRKAIRLSSSMVRTGIASEAIRMPRYFNNSEYVYLNNFFATRTSEFELTFKKFYYHNAPLGSYWGFIIGRRFTNVIGGEASFENNYTLFPPDEPRFFSKEVEKLTQNYIGIENGINRIVNDKWVLNASLSLRFNSFIFADKDNVATEDGLVVYEIKNRLQTLYAYRFDIKIGYLLF
jgi:hypothetical protein